MRMDYQKQLADLNLQIEENPENANLYAKRGYVFGELKEFENALSDYDKAIELDSTSAVLFFNRGNFWRTQREYEKALSDYDKAIELDPSSAKIFNNRGIVLAGLKRYTEAISSFDKAIDLNSNYALAFNNRGVCWHRLNEFEKAIEDYSKSIELDPAYALPLKNRGNLYSEFGNIAEALADHKAALALYETDGSTSMVQFLSNSIAELESKLQTAAALERIDSLMSDPEMDEIKQKMVENRNSFNTFIQDGFAARPELPLFHILRRWNSYTPIIAKNPFVSKGGGYFLQTNSHGIVVDPGFNFIDNFQQAGFRFKDMDTILITHAHNDHVTDLESILTLLYKYNDIVRGSAEEDIPGSILSDIRDTSPDITSDELERRTDADFAKSPRHKRLDIYMTSSTFKKYANFLDLKSSSDYTIHLIHAGDRLDFDRELDIRVLPARHNDILSDRDSVGFLFLYQDVALLYTGDTGFNSDIEQAYTNLKDEVLVDKQLVLLAHIGGFKSYEETYRMTAFNSGKAFYKNHLGRLGLARLVEILKPRLCIISEFGEEFTECRRQLSSLFQKHYSDTLFLPADIGLCLRLDLQIKAVTHVPPTGEELTEDDYGFILPEEVGTFTLERDNSLRYYKSDLDVSRLAQKHFS